MFFLYKQHFVLWNRQVGWIATLCWSTLEADTAIVQVAVSRPTVPRRVNLRSKRFDYDRMQSAGISKNITMQFWTLYAVSTNHQKILGVFNAFSSYQTPKSLLGSFRPFFCSLLATFLSRMVLRHNIRIFCMQFCMWRYLALTKCPQLTNRDIWQIESQRSHIGSEREKKGQ